LRPLFGRFCGRVPALRRRPPPTTKSTTAASAAGLLSGLVLQPELARPLPRPRGSPLPPAAGREWPQAERGRRSALFLVAHRKQPSASGSWPARPRPLRLLTWTTLRAAARTRRAHPRLRPKLKVLQVTTAVPPRPRGGVANRRGRAQYWVATIPKGPSSTPGMHFTRGWRCTCPSTVMLPSPCRACGDTFLVCVPCFYLFALEWARRSVYFGLRTIGKGGPGGHVTFVS